MAHDPLDRFDETEEPDAAPPARHQPDWLVGADEGVEAERWGADPGHGATSFELRRPAPRQAPEPSARELPGPSRRDGPGAESKGPVPWTGAASSVPRLREVAHVPAPPAHSVEPEPDADEESGPEDGFLDAPTQPGRAAAPPARPPRRPSPRPEAFWVVWLDLVASDRRLQIGIVLAVVVLLGVAFFPRGGGGVSISAIKHHPASYEGRAVRVQGRIGDVFVVGQGYVFNLHQGRDTLVVFTRLRSPRTRERTTVVGSISTGYLDGAPRIALFETQAP